jgi:hypothetical protein
MVEGLDTKENNLLIKVVSCPIFFLFVLEYITGLLLMIGCGTGVRGISGEGRLTFRNSANGRSFPASYISPHASTLTKESS